MKFELGVFALAGCLASSVVSAHPFTVCPNTVDHLHISSIEFAPDPPKSGKDFSVTVNFKPDETFEGGKGIFLAKVLGIKVFGTELDVCSYTKCPIPAGKEAKLTFAYPLPAEVPENVEVTVQVSLHDKSDKVVSCISTKVDMVGYDAKSKFDVLRSSGSMRASLTFLFDLWLQQFAEIAEIAWYPPESPDEVKTKAERFVIFAENFFKIAEHNRKHRLGQETYTMSMNQFGHLTNDEFAKIYLNGYSKELAKARKEKKTPVKKAFEFLRGSMDKLIRIPQEVFLADSKVSQSDLPDTVDWVAKGAVNPVKNQGSCGSCWAFAAISALESAYFIKYGELKSFSEQQLVSCENDCYGCGGGLIDLAFDWIKANGGICTESEYPYSSGGSGANGFCRPSRCTKDPKTAIQSLVDVDHSEEALMTALQQQPVAVAIEADQFAFQFYSGGVLTAECGDRLDHGVLAVGYGVYDNGVLFWKIRNSWGATWGLNGYILIERGKQTPAGDEECGILADPSYPVL